MDELDQLDHYAVLGAERSASTEEIKRAYRQQIARYHPDRYVSASPAEQADASRRAQRINEAYRVLSDFGARVAYNRTLAPDQRGAPARAASTTATAAPTRDHLAELYEQARGHLDAGRRLQAAATLREIQKINPFYRDSAALLGQAEAAARPAAPPPAPAEAAAPANRGRRAMIVGGVGLLGLLGAGVALGALRRGGATAGAPSPAPAAGGAAPSAVAIADTATIAATNTAQPSPEPATATAAPPTATPEPTLEPTATVPPATATPEPLAEEGTLVYANDFTTGVGWPTIDGGSWRVGFAQGAYQIVAQQGAGNIWAFNTSPAGSDYQVAVDVEASGGLGGLLLRYTDGSYLAFFVNPAAAGFRLEQRLGGRVAVLAEEAHPAVNSDPAAQNRLLARLEGERIELRINGVPAADLSLASPAPSARYGMVVVARDAQVDARFRNLALWSL
jgi:hypothetical protein